MEQRGSPHKGLKQEALQYACTYSYVKKSTITNIYSVCIVQIPSEKHLIFRVLILLIAIQLNQLARPTGNTAVYMIVKDISLVVS